MKIKFNGFDFGGEELRNIFFQADVFRDNIRTIGLFTECDDKFWENLNKDKCIKKARKYLEGLLKESGDVLYLVDDDLVIPI